MNKVAMISGVNGQDGSYLSDLLLEKKYTVIGLKRRTVGVSENNSFLVDGVPKSIKSYIQIESDYTDKISEKYFITPV